MQSHEANPPPPRAHPSSESRPQLEYPGRVPPQDIDAERAVLGSILLSNEAVYTAIEALQPDDFYRPAHQLIYRAMLDLVTRSEPVDNITLQAKLKGENQLEAVGGLAAIVELAEVVPTAAHIKHYAELVRDKATLRKLINASTQIATSAFEGGRADDVLDQAERMVFDVSMVKARRGVAPISDIVKDAFRRIEILYEQKKEITGVATGFIDVDRMTAGLQPSDLIIVAGRPSMGKCLAADTELVLADGRMARIEDVVRSGDAEVLTLTDRWRLEPSRPSAYVDDGERPAFRVTTRLGRSIEVTLTHPFLTIDGWRPLAELRVGTRVAVPRVIPVFGTRVMREAEIKLLAYLLGDGGLTGSSPLFTNQNPRLRGDFSRAAVDFGGVGVVRAEAEGRTPTLRVRGAGRKSARRAAARQVRRAVARRRGAARRLALAVGVTPAAVSRWVSGDGAPSERVWPEVCEHLGLREAGPGVANPLMSWLERLDLWGAGAADKHIPEPVFELPKNQLALFLNRLFATDGWATVLKSGQAQVGYCSVSERLARQVQHLLLRFGVIAALKKRSVRYRGGRRNALQLDVTDARSLERFIDEIGIFGKEAAVEAVRRAIGRRARYQTNRDLIPVEVWRHLERLKGQEPWTSVARRAGLPSSNIHAHRRAPTRDRLLALANALDAPGMAALAESDVYWDEIVGIEAVGMKRVFDLSIPHTHNFVAADVCVHNTSFAINMGSNAALREHTGVAIFSLEMSKEQLVMRMLCSEGRIDLARMRGGFLEESDWPKLAKAAGTLSEAPMFIDDSGSLSVLEVRAKCRRIAAEKGLGLIIIDYLQLMRGSPNAQSREQEISEISRGLKSLAKELNVPVIALSQLNRSLEQRADKRPVLSDLRESGAIEQDADVIMFVYRDEVYEPKEENRGIAEIIIGKQRNGPIGTARAKFFHSYTRFDNLVDD